MAKKLLPFWRGKANDRGFNVKRFLTEPKDFDLILFIHGTGALPHVERGDVTSVEKWEQFPTGFLEGISLVLQSGSIESNNPRNNRLLN